MQSPNIEKPKTKYRHGKILKRRMNTNPSQTLSENRGEEPS